MTTTNPTPTEHLLPPQFLDRPIPVAIAGAGGNGSQFLNGLARLHLALRAAGHPHGFAVTVFDADVVTKANVGRQLFSQADIGQRKATVLVHRVNLFFGLNWHADPHDFPLDHLPFRESGIIVGCVDSARSRRAIHFALATCHFPLLYWLDLGNESHTGQVILGSTTRGGREKDGVGYVRLPFVTDLYPELMDAARPETNLPSCSLLEALGKQDLFINQAVSTQALQLLWTFFRTGRLRNHGSFINLEAGTVRPLPVDPAVWQRMGYPAAEPDKPRGKPKPKAKPKARKQK